MEILERFAKNNRVAIIDNGVEFSYKDLNDKAISNHIKQMQKLNIIKNRLLPSENGMATYQVVDPRIIHMIERGVLEFD